MVSDDQLKKKKGEQCSNCIAYKKTSVKIICISKVGNWPLGLGLDLSFLPSFLFWSLRTLLLFFFVFSLSLLTEMSDMIHPFSLFNELMYSNVIYCPAIVQHLLRVFILQTRKWANLCSYSCYNYLTRSSLVTIYLRP